MGWIRHQVLTFAQMLAAILHVMNISSSSPQNLQENEESMMPRLRSAMESCHTRPANMNLFTVLGAHFNTYPPGPPLPLWILFLMWDEQ